MSSNLNIEVAEKINVEIEKSKVLRPQDVKALKDKLHSTRLKGDDWELYIENAVEAEKKAGEKGI